jgi:hypothetical protein
MSCSGRQGTGCVPALFLVYFLLFNPSSPSRSASCALSSPHCSHSHPLIPLLYLYMINQPSIIYASSRSPGTDPLRHSSSLALRCHAGLRVELGRRAVARGARSPTPFESHV